MIIMRLFGGKGVKATVAYLGFTIMIGSVGYEARHVSYPSVVTFPVSGSSRRRRFT